MAKCLTIVDAMREKTCSAACSGAKPGPRARARPAGFYGLPLDDDATETWRTLNRAPDRGQHLGGDPFAERARLRLVAAQDQRIEPGLADLVGRAMATLNLI